MDLREKKTKRSIKQAFMQLRSQKPLERISVKELAKLAEISKATFYLHYHDLYDLSDQLQKEVIQNVLNSIQQPEVLLSDIPKFTNMLFHAFEENQAQIDILFSGAQSAVLPLSIERELKEYIFQFVPQARNNAKYNIVLSYQILGGFYIYQNYREKYGLDYIMNVLNDVCRITYPKAE